VPAVLPLRALVAEDEVRMAERYGGILAVDRCGLQVPGGHLVRLRA
jgi:hypothetical protein